MTAPRKLSDLIVGDGASSGAAPQAEWWKGTPIPEGAKPKDMGWPEFLDNIGRKVASGAALGWADEFAAAADAATQPVLGRGSDAQSFGERYDANLGKEQKRDKEFDAEYPKTATTAEIGGNVAGAMATIPRAMVTAATVPLQVLKGVGTGAALGGVAGAGGADPGQRVEGAVRGAELGSAVGAAVPMAGAAVQKFGPRILDYVGLRNADKGAVSQLFQAFERDGIPLEEAGRRYQAWQAAGAKPEALVDLGAENVRLLAETASNTPSASRTAAGKLVETRKAGASERVGEDVGRAISPDTNYAQTVDELMKSRKVAADPLYQKMRQAPTYWDPELEALMKRPSMKEAWSKAQRLAAEEGVDLPKVWALNAEGDLVRTSEARPDWASWDYIKRGLDEVIEGNRDKFGKMTDTGRTTTGTREQLLGILDKANPDYAAARAAYSGPSQSLDAMKLGRSILQEDADITAKSIKDLTQGDKEFFRSGVAKAIQDKVENTVDGRDVVASFFNKLALRKKLEAAFDTPEQFTAFEEAMKREMNMASVNNQVSPRGGSPTFRRGQGAEDMQRDPVTAFEHLLQGNLGGAAGSVARSMIRPNQRMNSSTADALAPLLFETDPMKVQAALQRVGDSAPKFPMVNDMRAALARALMPTAAEQAGDMAAPRRPLAIDRYRQ